MVSGGLQLSPCVASLLRRLLIIVTGVAAIRGGGIVVTRRSRRRRCRRVALLRSTFLEPGSHVSEPCSYGPGSQSPRNRKFSRQKRWATLRVCSQSGLFLSLFWSCFMPDRPALGAASQVPTTWSAGSPYAALLPAVDSSFPGKAWARSSEAMQIKKHITLTSNRFRGIRVIAENSLDAMLR